MDTDSNYFALASETLQEIVKPEKADDLQILLYGSCFKLPTGEKDMREVRPWAEYMANGKVDDIIIGGDYWLPRLCCPEHK